MCVFLFSMPCSFFLITGPDVPVKRSFCKWASGSTAVRCGKRWRVLQSCLLFRIHSLGEPVFLDFKLHKYFSPHFGGTGWDGVEYTPSPSPLRLMIRPQRPCSGSRVSPVSNLPIGLIKNSCALRQFRMVPFWLSPAGSLKEFFLQGLL